MSQFRIYRGVSLIETLVAMFVLAIGLASLAALLPVGQSQVVKANLDDRKSVVGRAAWQEIQTRGMLDYKYWTFLKTTAYNAQWTDSVGTAPTTIKPPFAFAIDPLMVAVASEATPVVANRVRFFPYSVIPPSGPSGDPTIVPCMYRLSLADYSLLSAVPGGNVTSWPPALAEDVFYLHNNLNFVLPEPGD